MRRAGRVLWPCVICGVPHLGGDLGEAERNEIDGLRETIDKLDVELVRLLNARAKAAHRIGRVKQDANLPVYEPRREEDVFSNVKRMNMGPLSDADMLHVYERIIDVMRSLQRREENQS